VISYPFLRNLKKSASIFNSAFYSARAINATFSSFLALKFDPDVIETFCFLPLKAEIHAVLVAKRLHRELPVDI
jgi:hypothetical protein